METEKKIPEILKCKRCRVKITADFEIEISACSSKDAVEAAIKEFIENQEFEVEVEIAPFLEIMP